MRAGILHPANGEPGLTIARKGGQIRKQHSHVLIPTHCYGIWLRLVGPCKSECFAVPNQSSRPCRSCSERGTRTGDNHTSLARLICLLPQRLAHAPRLAQTRNLQRNPFGRKAAFLNDGGRGYPVAISLPQAQTPDLGNHATTGACLPNLFERKRFSACAQEPPLTRQDDHRMD